MFVFFFWVSFEVEELCGAKRREVVLQLTIAAFSFPAIISSAKAFTENGAVLISHFHFLVDSTFLFSQILCLKLSCYSNYILYQFSDVPENFRVYTDDVNKFKILIPQGE